MLQEAIEYVHALGIKSFEPKFVRMPGNPSHIIYHTDKNGVMTQKVVEPGPREVIVTRLDDLISIAKKHFDDHIAEAGKMVCTYNEGRVELWFDHRNGREKVIYPLKLSGEWGFFHRHTTDSTIEPEALRTALRFFLRKTFNDRNLVEQISNIAFGSQQQASTSLAVGKESLGTSILAQVEKTVKLPAGEQIFNVRKWDNPDVDFRVKLECVLEPEVKSRRWFLRPYEDSWVEFNNTFIKKLGEKLREKMDAIPVYEGTIRYENPKSG